MSYVTCACLLLQVYKGGFLSGGYLHDLLQAEMIKQATDIKTIKITS